MLHMTVSIQRCECQSGAQVLANDGSGVVPVTERLKNDVMATVAMYGGSLALRCLGLAFRHMPANQATVRALVPSHHTMLCQT